MAKYSVAEAKSQLPRLLRQAEAGDDVNITRRGQPVAVIISSDRYEALEARQSNFSAKYRSFRQLLAEDDFDIDPDNIFGDRRDVTAGRDFSW